MHTTLVRWAVVFGAMLFSLEAIAAEPAGIRDHVRLKFDGVERVSERDILAALLIDFDVALAAHPDAPLDGYLRAVETSTLLGYRHSGFRDAVVAATHDEQQSQIVMRVKEGPRYFCGDVNITGAKSADIGLLIQAITQPTNKESTPWVEGRPVPFDVATTRETILRLKSAFAAQGFLRSSFAIQNTAGTGSETATLEITVQDEGPRAEIGQITVNGNERDSDADLLQYLNLQPGQRYDSNLEERLQSRLEASGRFLSTTVTRVDNTRIEGDKEIVGLSLGLRDYDFAPPLTKAFTAEETALLKFRDWFGRWANDKTDHDIVCEMTLGPQGLDKLFDELEMPLPSQYRGRLNRADLRIVISPHHGQTLTLRLFDAKQQPLFDEAIVFYPDHLLIGNSVRGVKFQVPHPNAGQLTVNIQAKTDKSSAETERPFSLTLGMTVKSRPHASGTAVRVATEISPGAALSFFEPANEATCRLRNGAWKLRSGKLRAQIDATTGQLLKLSAKSPSGKNEAEGQIPNRLKIFTESAAFERETRAIEQALALAQAQDTHDGLKSFLNFALEEWSFALTQ